MAAWLRLNVVLRSGCGRRAPSPGCLLLLKNVLSPVRSSTSSILNLPSSGTLILSPTLSSPNGFVFLRNLSTTSEAASQAPPCYQTPSNQNQQGYPNYGTSISIPNPNHNPYPGQGYSNPYPAPGNVNTANTTEPNLGFGGNFQQSQRGHSQNPMLYHPQNYNKQNAGYSQNQNCPNQSAAYPQSPLPYQGQNHPNQNLGYAQNPIPYQGQNYRSQDYLNQNGGHGNGIPYDLKNNQGYSRAVNQNQVHFTQEGTPYPCHPQAQNQGQQSVSNYPQAQNQGQQAVSNYSQAQNQAQH